MSTPALEKHIIRFGHSPDPDDAFMFYALAHHKINTGRYEFKDVILDIEALNRLALRAELEITAVSVHTFAYIADRYTIMPCGASVGDKYGPIIVARRAFSASQLGRYRIGVPGEFTTAFLALKIFDPHITSYTVLPFDKIIPAVLSGDIDAGLVIHEGQLTYEDLGLKLILDLGKWWYAETKLPLPLGIDVVRKDLGTPTITEVTKLFRQSIVYGLKHRKRALNYALMYGRGLARDKADRFIDMYVNEVAVDCGEAVRTAIQVLLERGLTAKLYSHVPPIEFVGGAPVVFQNQHI
ncbi:MAG: ABC transporter substrate-binding protein [Candidatus Omnitrophica bacterium]|nr:ABC transporter substrate-binding protein [Candidatus Omnitrophota bacterium]